MYVCPPLEQKRRDFFSLLNAGRVYSSIQTYNDFHGSRYFSHTFPSKYVTISMENDI